MTDPITWVQTHGVDVAVAGWLFAAGTENMPEPDASERGKSFVGSYWYAWVYGTAHTISARWSNVKAAYRSLRTPSNPESQSPASSQEK